MPTWDASDIEHIIKEQHIGHLSTDEIVISLTAQALKLWKDDHDHVKQLLWDEKIDDTEAERLFDSQYEATGDYITAVHMWARA